MKRVEKLVYYLEFGSSFYRSAVSTIPCIQRPNVITTIFVTDYIKYGEVACVAVATTSGNKTRSSCEIAPTYCVTIHLLRAGWDEYELVYDQRTCRKVRKIVFANDLHTM